MASKTRKKHKNPEPANPTLSISRPAVIAISLFLAAFLVRLYYLFQIRSGITFTNPIMDSLYYIKEAREIAAGTHRSDRAFFMGPLYPYLLGLIIKLIGFGWMKLRLVQIVIGSFSVVLVYKVAGRCFAEDKMAIPAAILSLFWGIFIYYDTNLLMAFWVVFLNLLLLWSLQKLLTDPAPLKFFSCGVVLGLSALSRANILLFVPFCLIWFYGAFRLRFPPRILAGRSALFLLGTALMVLSVTARNYSVEGDWVLITSNGGLNFYIGNNPYSKGVYIPLKELKLPYGPTPPFPSNLQMDFQARKIAEKVEARPLKSSEISAFWYGRSREFIQREPLAFLRNIANKVALCWNADEIPQIENYYFFRKRSFLLGIPLVNFGILAPLALWGVLSGLMGPRQEIRLLIYYLIAMTLAVSLFFVTSRYRAPLVPPVLILAVSTIFDLAGRLRRGEWTGAGKGILGVGVFALLVNQPMVNIDFATDYYNRGIMYYQTGEPGKALEEFSTCISIRPDYADAYRSRGIIYRGRNLFDRALTEFNQALALDPGSSDIKTHIAILYLEQGRVGQARQLLEQLLYEDEDFPLGLLTMGRLLVDEGRMEEAKTVLFKAAKISPEMSDTYFVLGEISALQSQFEMAAGYYQTAIDKDGQNADGLLYYKLGVAYHRFGRFGPAEEALLKALSKDPALTRTHTALGNLFLDLKRLPMAVKHMEIAYRRRPDISNRYNLANTYAEAGYDEKAIETYEGLLLIQPDHKRALNNMGNVFLNKEQYDKAITYYQRAFKADPQFSIPLHNLGDIYNGRNNFSRAFDYYKKSLLLENDPGLRAVLEEKLKSLEGKIR